MIRQMSLVWVFLAGAVSLAAAQSETAKQPAEDKWAKEIASMLARDEKNSPPEEGIVFAGSSSIRLWDLAKAFPGQPVVNRGFGGSQIHDVTKYAPKIVTPLKPKLIVFYAGDNDIKAGKTPEKTAADFAEFCEVVHKELPKTKIWYIAIKPCPSRWTLFDKQTTANKLVRAQCEQDPDRLLYIDIVPAMLGDDGQPRPDLFVKDMLHLSPAGYQIWNEHLRKLLEQRKPLN